MDTNVIIAIVAIVVIAALLLLGGWWFGKSRKKAVDKSVEDAKAKADERLAQEVQKAETAQEAEEVQEVAAEVPPIASTEEAKAAPAVETPESTGSRIQRLKAKLAKSGNPFGKVLFNILAKDHLSESDWEDVEDTLLLADVGAEASEQLVEELRNDARISGQSDLSEVRKALKDKLLKLVGTDTDRRLNADKEGANKPSVIIMVGVNGTGKTTTAGKLARLFVADGKQVMMGAADQLETWGAKVGVPVVRSDKDGADPASVAFEASEQAKETHADVLIIDTAGRLQNKANLMDELGKIRRVTEKNLPVDEVLLVLDATTGQNGLSQAREFDRALDLDGVIVTKLDGTAKGGIALAVSHELGLPVLKIGVGEGLDDLRDFDAHDFARALVGEFDERA